MRVTPHESLKSVDHQAQDEPSESGRGAEQCFPGVPRHGRLPRSAITIEVYFKDETEWMTQKALAKLFDVGRTVITKHLRNIFKDGELAENSVCANFAHTAADGKVYQTRYCDLDAIIAVGYRVNSYQATQFRIWATKTLQEFRYGMACRFGPPNLTEAQHTVRATACGAGHMEPSGGADAEVCKDLRGPLLKHYWPENPLEAEATRGARRRT
jgi:hypothetical protein